MPDQIPYIRVFISSPGDVNAERKIALDVIDYFPNRPAYREKVAFRVVAWDKPGAGTAMLGTLTPQEAINRGLPKPSECDIVVVIFWSRMGTPFTDTDGTEYLSGTHWEMLDALDGDRPETIIFRRREEKLFKSSDKKGREQYDRVEDFFKSDLFYRKDGSIVRGVNHYATPDDFRRDFEIFFEELVVRLLDRYDKGKTQPPPPPPAPNTPQAQAEAENVRTVQADIWDGSPFPGLRAFTEADAPIFFGRGRETDALVQQLENSRFVAVVGASGSGKSSLVGAGLIPRLKANAIEGSADWLYVRFTPGTGNNPFETLVAAITDTVPSLAVSGDAFVRRKAIKDRTGMLLDDPAEFIPIIEDALQDSPEHVNLMLFIDQFEELFTLANVEHAAPFAAMLASAAESDRLRVVVTMRADFYHRAVEYESLAELLRSGSFPLAAPRRDALRQMIERPAERAGLQLEAGLVDRILDDTGDEPGNLALMAYALDELYKIAEAGAITLEDYDQLGGVEGAIGTRAESVFKRLGSDDGLLQRVFQALVEVDDRGTATRRRAVFQPDALSESERDLIYAFADARLLTTSYDEKTDTAMVEIAHEALFRSWDTLVTWIANTRDDLRLLRQIDREAADWHKGGREYLLTAERLKPVHEAIVRLEYDLNPITHDFVYPQAMLLAELEKPETDEKRRLRIGDDLDLLGDPREGIGVKEGVPDIAWLPVDGSNGPYEFKFGTFEVRPFFIAKYQVTYAQYQAFVEAEDGFDNLDWWQDFPEKYRPQELSEQRTKNRNNPRDSVSWYQSVAFARWINHRLRGLALSHPDGVLRVGDNAEIRLPTEWEWQWAAQGGAEEREYPWGGWQRGYANTNETGLGRAIAVGMYPHGAAACGALDLSGNIFEWCLNDENNHPLALDYRNIKRKVLRGGSFGLGQDFAAASFRYDYFPGLDDYYHGVRVVLSPLS